MTPLQRTSYYSDDSQSQSPSEPVLAKDPTLEPCAYHLHKLALGLAFPPL